MKDKGELSPRRKALRSRIASLAGRVGAASRIAKAGYDGKEATKPASAAYWNKLMDQCDPQHELEPDERMAKAKQLWQLNMQKAQLKRARAALRKAG